MKILKKMMFATLVLALIVALPAIFAACGKDNVTPPPTDTTDETPVVPTTVSIMFDGNGGRVEAEALSIAPNQAIALPSTGASKQYSQFLGWNTDRYARTGFFTYNVTTRNVTFYAIWRTEKADVRFVSDESGASLPALMRLDKGTKITLWSFLNTYSDTSVENLNTVFYGSFVDHFIVNGVEKRFNDTIIIDDDTVIEPVFETLERISFPASETVTSVKLKNGTTVSLSTINSSSNSYQFVLPNPKTASYELSSGEKFVFAGWSYNRTDVAGSLIPNDKASNMLQPGEVFLIYNSSDLWFFYPIYTSTAEGSSSLSFTLDSVTDSYIVRQFDKQYKGVVIIPETYMDKPVTKIAIEGFANSQSTAMIIPSSITEIGKAAFKGSRLAHVHFAGETSLTTISESAFEETENLHKITLPDGIVSIGKRTFYYSGLREIKLPGSLETIGEYAFSQIQTDLRISLNQGLREIGNFAFYNTNFYGETIINYESTLVIPSSVNMLGESAFKMNEGRSSHLRHVVFDESVDNSQINTIQKSVFEGQTNLKTVSLPQWLYSIGDYAFARTSLVNLVIPNSTSNFGEGAFSKLQNNEGTRIEITNQWTIQIGELCFRDSIYLTELVIHASVINLGVGMTYCANLRSMELSIIFTGTNGVTSINYGSDETYNFDTMLQNNTMLRVPAVHLSTYKSNNPELSTFFTENDIPSKNLEYIYGGTDYITVALKSGSTEAHVVVPSTINYYNMNQNVYAVDEYGFNNNHSLLSIDFIGTYHFKNLSFNNCMNLTTIYIRTTSYTIVFDEGWLVSCPNLTAIYVSYYNIADYLKTTYPEYAHLFISLDSI